MNITAKVLLACVLMAAQANARADLALTHVNVLSMDQRRSFSDKTPLADNTMLADQTVLVRGNTVAVLGPADSVTVPEGVQLIDGNNRFLIPGLTDVHVHLDPVDGRELLFYLANGVTTVVSLSGDERFLELRERLTQDDALGPRLFTCGPFARDVTDVDAGVTAVRAVAEAGYDCVKFYGDWDADAFIAATDTARDLGLLTIGHAPRNHDFDLIEVSSLRGLAHLEEVVYADPVLNRWLDTYRGRSDEPAAYSDPKRSLAEPIRKIADRVAASGIWVIPTNIVMDAYLKRFSDAFDAFARRPYLRYLDPVTRSEWRNNRGQGRAARFHQQFRLQQVMLKAFHEAGVPMALGTDASQGTRLSVMPGWSVHEELQLAVDAGIPAFDAIKMATVNAAGFLERSDEGVIRAGARADLLLLNTNPLDDIANTQDIAGVVRAGHWWPRNMLDARLAELQEPDVALPAP